MSIREIMTPRQKISRCPRTCCVEEASAQVIDHHHSRVPVYDETRGPEHIVGVVYSKDLARLMYFRLFLPALDGRCLHPLSNSGSPR